MDTFSSVCFELVVPIADEKSNGPVANLVFLGLEIDTIEMVIQIPHEKLIRLKSLLEPLYVGNTINFFEKIEPYFNIFPDFTSNFK
jgi:hypothetical protein